MHLCEKCAPLCDFDRTGGTDIRPPFGFASIHLIWVCIARGARSNGPRGRSTMAAVMRQVSTCLDTYVKYSPRHLRFPAYLLKTQTQKAHSLAAYLNKKH